MEQTLPERLIKALASMDPVAHGALADALEAWVASAGLGEVAPSMFGEAGSPLRQFPAYGALPDARAD